MPATPSEAATPAPVLFTGEVGDDINKLKSMVNQMVFVLRDEGTTITLPTYVAGDTPIDTMRKTLAVIMTAMDSLSVPYTVPTFGDTDVKIGDSYAHKIGSTTQMDDGQTVRLGKLANVLFEALQYDGYIA